MISVTTPTAPRLSVVCVALHNGVIEQLVEFRNIQWRDIGRFCWFKRKCEQIGPELESSTILECTKIQFFRLEAFGYGQHSELKGKAISLWHTCGSSTKTYIALWIDCIFSMCLREFNISRDTAHWTPFQLRCATVFVCIDHPPVSYKNK